MDRRADLFLLIITIIAVFAITLIFVWHEGLGVPQLRAECEVRGGTLILTRDMQYVCVATK